MLGQSKGEARLVNTSKEWGTQVLQRRTMGKGLTLLYSLLELVTEEDETRRTKSRTYVSFWESLFDDRLSHTVWVWTTAGAVATRSGIVCQIRVRESLQEGRAPL